MRILVAIDGMESTGDVLAAAAEWARSDDEVHVLHIVNPKEVKPTFSTSEGPREHAHTYVQPTRLPAESTAQATERVHEEQRALVNGLLRELPGAQDWHVHIDVDSDPASCILRTTDELAADAIVMAAKNRGRLARAILGSVTEQVVRHAAVPVLLVSATPRAAEQGEATRTASVQPATG
jgi:nucleotide-binding universal stress UspA family protein